jgi:hypothetical protein
MTTFNFNFTKRQVVILCIALTELYNDISKSGVDEQLRDDIKELTKLYVELSETIDLETYLFGRIKND